MKYLLIIISLFFLTPVYSQSFFTKHLPRSAFTLQYGGSTGFMTVGYSRLTGNRHLELGVLYGAIPRFVGRPNQTLSFKVAYNPVEITFSDKLVFEPMKPGVFVAENFGEDHGLQWGKEYPHRYYWWTRSLRIHVFATSQLSYVLDHKKLDRVSAYFEVNTNDLYIASYLPNRKALSLYDIFFFGLGMKLYLK